jgi:dTDP-4-amino-4,6-dideoxygalactose transaminase
MMVGGIAGLRPGRQRFQQAQDPQSFTMDVNRIEKAITARTKAILLVHLYGQMADRTGILEIANRHGIPVIEDACHAHGAEIDGRRAGSIGFSGAFSF